jgi:hypothetical protein
MPSLPRAASSLLGRLAPSGRRERVRGLTGIGESEWREIAAAFPGVPPDPGRQAASRRALLGKLASRALATGRWKFELDGEPLGPEPTVYVTGHLGALQAMRYALRSRGVLVASVIGRLNLDRSVTARSDPIFDRRYALDFPHALPSTRPHGLARALRKGCLIVAADLPEGPFVEVPFLGATVRLDPRPFRLARAGGAVCRPAFLTLPESGWRLTVGERLPPDPTRALQRFGELFHRVAAAAPLDLDGLVYLSFARRRA